MVSPYRKIRNNGILGEWNDGLIWFSNIPVFHYSIGLRGFEPEDGFFFLALNGFEFTHLIAEMASRTETRFNMRNPFPLLSIHCHRHLPFYGVIRDSWTT